MIALALVDAQLLFAVGVLAAVLIIGGAIAEHVSPGAMERAADLLFRAEGQD